LPHAGTAPERDRPAPANIAPATQAGVRALPKLRASTDQSALSNFTCVVDTTGVPSGALLLTSGVASPVSSVRVIPAANSSQDAAGVVQVGQPKGGRGKAGGGRLPPPDETPAPPPPRYHLFFWESHT